MTRPRLAFSLLLLACAPPSDEPPDDDEGADTEGSSTLEPPETTGESSETTAVESSESMEPTSSTSTSSTSTSESGASSETTEGGPECGDGLVTGEEVCDDGVNDGSYGGCAIGCGALASHCGDGAWDEPQEMCDEGEGNANGTGCNVDCVISGTLLFEYEIGTGTDSCFNGTEPAVRADGSVLFAYRHACADATRLVELSPELEEVAWQDVLLTSFGDQATVLGTDWILGAFECDQVRSSVQPSRRNPFAIEAFPTWIEM
jgi:hypothetical protein